MKIAKKLKFQIQTEELSCGYNFWPHTTATCIINKNHYYQTSPSMTMQMHRAAKLRYKQTKPQLHMICPVLPVSV